VSATSPDFAARAEDALGDAFLRQAVKHTVERLAAGKARSTAALAAGDWEALREQGRRVRAHVIEHLDYYLEQFADNVEARGQTVHFAADAAEATRIVLDIARRRQARLVAKSKSMLSEEIHLNHALEEAGVECLETDLGEWIIQLAHETPSHLIIPAIHKNRAQIRQLFEREGGEPLTPETRVLADYARRRLRERFLAADVGMTGCNFAVADSGSIVLFTNEGNGRMVTTLPRTHVVIMGMERILPSLSDVALFAALLPRSATGQKLTTYVNVLNGARREAELDGARELHVVIVDNGRSRQLGDPHFQEILHCIRCGACLNVCPVYRHVGGHAYASVYSGPIGAVLTPLLHGDDPRARELSQASSLCGACFEACPVKIPLHDMLVQLRQRDATEKGGREALAFSAYAAVVRRPWLYRLVTRLGRWLLRRLGARARRLPVLGAWTRHRALPVVPDSSFRQQWRAAKKP
jgi:L-lactate dehydrogenase complex protein LldF